MWDEPPKLFLLSAWRGYFILFSLISPFLYIPRASLWFPFSACWASCAFFLLFPLCCSSTLQMDGGDQDEVWRCLLWFPHPSQHSDQCFHSGFIVLSKQKQMLAQLCWRSREDTVRTLCCSGSLHQKLDHGIIGIKDGKALQGHWVQLFPQHWQGHHWPHPKVPHPQRNPPRNVTPSCTRAGQPFLSLISNLNLPWCSLRLSPLILHGPLTMAGCCQHPSNLFPRHHLRTITAFTLLNLVTSASSRSPAVMMNNDNHIQQSVGLSRAGSTQNTGNSQPRTPGKALSPQIPN